MLTIEIQNLHVRVSIGVYEWERKIKRECLISLSVEFDDTMLEKTRKISDGIDYDDVVTKVKTLCGKSHFDLKEDLIYAIRDMVKLYKNAVSTKISIQKLGISEDIDGINVSGHWKF